MIDRPSNAWTQAQAGLVPDVPKGSSDEWFSLRRARASPDAQSSDGGSQCAER